MADRSGNMVTVHVENVGNVTRMLTLLADRGKLQRGLARVGAFFADRLKVYPKAPAHSRYRRTGTLRRRWRVRQQGLNTIVSNSTPYAEYVQGKRQAYFHRQTGWQTPDDIMELRGRTIEHLLLMEIEK